MNMISAAFQASLAAPTIGPESSPFPVAVECVFQIVCFLSMAGSLAIIVTYVAFDDLRSVSRRLLVYLSIADLGTAATNSAGMFSDFWKSDRPKSTECKVQAGFAIFFSLSSYFWTTFIAIYLYSAIVRQRQVTPTLLWMFHAFAWGVPLLITSLAAGFDVLGLDLGSYNASINNKPQPSLTGGWCFLRAPYSNDSKVPTWYNEKAYMGWIVVAASGWEVLAFILCVVFYLLIKWYFYQERRRSDSILTRESFAAANSVDQKLAFIPLVFFLLHVWAVSSDIISYNGKAHRAGWLAILEGIGDSAQGIANCLMFCFFTKTVRQRWRVSLALCWVNCKLFTGTMRFHDDDALESSLIFRAGRFTRTGSEVQKDSRGASVSRSSREGSRTPLLLSGK